MLVVPRILDFATGIGWKIFSEFKSIFSPTFVKDSHGNWLIAIHIKKITKVLGLLYRGT